MIRRLLSLTIAITLSATTIFLSADLPAISADGSTIAFQSDASNLVAGDTNAIRDIFVRGPTWQ